MKKWSRHLLAAGALALGMSAAHADDNNTLYFYNWTEYVPPGLLEQFTKETGIKVIYSTYESNETMYAKLKTYKDDYNTGESRGRETSHSLNYQKLGKELMSQDELAVMDGGKCILQLRGVRPFLSDKYDITKHPNFKYTADADDKNAFDIEAFLSARLKLKPNEVCDVYEVDTKGA